MKTVFLFLLLTGSASAQHTACRVTYGNANALTIIYHATGTTVTLAPGGVVSYGYIGRPAPKPAQVRTFAPVAGQRWEPYPRLSKFGGQ